VKPNCRRICDLLAQYADGALSQADRAEVQRHLGACPPCRTIAGQECGARQLLRACADRLKAETLPPGLKSRCQALSAASSRSRPTWLRRLVPLAVTVLLIVLAGSLFSVVTRHSDALLAAQLTADHMKCFGLFRPADGESVEAEQVQRMLATRFGLDVHVPPSSPTDTVQLLNARRCLYGEGRISHLMYQANGQDVSLFILEGEARPAAELDSLGHHTRIWSRGGNTFVLVSPAAGAQVAGALQYVQQEAR
jgi:anti-sigma factor (TIGR02949 family)